MISDKASAKIKYFNVTMLKCSNDCRFLILVMLIISTLLVASLTVGDVILRNLKVTQGIEYSEKAYYAAESGMEKVIYNVFKSGCLVDSSGNCGVDDSLVVNGAHYKVSNNAIGIATSSAPWTVTVSAGRALQFSFDLNGATYPSSINISQGGTGPSDMVVWRCTTTNPNPSRICSSEQSQTFYPTIPSDSDPLPLNLPLNIPTNYYKLRINNRGANEETYRFSWTSPPDYLPIGLIIDKSEGSFGNYRRQIQSTPPDHFPKWQIISP